MTRRNLLELILNGEGSGLEFKRDQLRPEKLAREIVALANLRGGRVLLGVADHGSIVGLQRSDLERWVMDTVFGHMIHPTIFPYYEEVQVDEDTRVAVITVTEGTQKPYVVRYRGAEDIFVRLGSTTRRASREQQLQLFARGGLINAEELPVSGTGIEHLSLKRISDYLLNFFEEDASSYSRDNWYNKLCDFSFMTDRPDDSPVCTIAGLVLFGHSPRRLLPVAGIRWMAFEGLDRDKAALDDRVLDGPLAPLRGRSGRVLSPGLIEECVAVMHAFITAEASPSGGSMRRQKQYLFPVKAVRESIVNAVSHRDWTRPGHVEVVRYSDRLEVQSPGGLPNSMTIQKMIGGRRAWRNPITVRALCDYGYADARGLGVRRTVIPLVRECSGREPLYVATEDFVRVAMPRGAGGTVE